MRQAGVLAAPGLVAVDGWSRVQEDHAAAKALAAGLAEIDGVTVRGRVDTNIVIFGPNDATAPPALTATSLVAGLEARGVRVAAFRGAVRAVTSYEVGSDGMKQAIAAVAVVVADARAGKLGGGEGVASY